MNFPVLMGKSSFVGISPLLSIPFSFYKTFFSFYSFGSCSSPLFSFSFLYKKFFMDENLANLEVVTSVYQLPPVPMAAPWLVFSDREEGDITEQLFYNIFERPYSKTHKRNIPEMSRWFRYYQSPSHQGWLLVYCHLEQYPILWRLKFGDCFLWNPVSLKKIWLPSIQGWITENPEGRVFVRCGLLSAPPTMNPTVDNGFMVFFLLDMVKKDPDNDNRRVEHFILFCRPGDKHWKSRMLPGIVFPQFLACFKGKLHVLCNNNVQLVIETQLGSDGKMHLSITEFPVAQDTFRRERNRQIDLLESHDELYAVVTNHHLVPSYENITSFEVFRMNFSLMVWEKVKSLGDHVLFLGGTTKASCSAADLGLTRGYVYFLEDETVHVFDLKDGTISFDIAFSSSTNRCFHAQWVSMPMSIGINANEAKPNIKTSSLKVIEEEGNKKSEESEMLKSGAWGSLDMDILELIAGYLHTVDYVHFRAVCKNHRSVASVPRKRTMLETSHTTSLSPWLILHQKNQDCVYRFINPMHNNETYLINLSEYLLDATILCSKGGWLLMSKSCKRNLLFFFNPFTRDMIKLPELPEYMRDFEDISFSSMPTSSDCTVFAISGNTSIVFTTTISRGYDSWSLNCHENKKLSFMEEYLTSNLCLTNPIFHEGCFYCLSMRGTLGVFDIRSEHWKVLEKLVPACTSYNQSFLVECEGQLLSVFLTSLQTRPVQIFKLHTSKKTNRRVWVKVRDLGKYMLFVSHTSCIAAVAPVTRMKNKIYFPRLHNGRIVFFSLDTCRYRTLFLTGSDECSSSDFYSTKKYLFCTWIEPNWSHATDTELVWS